MQKTVTVQVTDQKVHPIYKKRYPVTTKFHAHTDEVIEEGARVTIEETAPTSKTKRWKVVTSQ